MNELKIHDIKELVEVPDISFYIYYGLISLGVIICCIFIYFAYKFIINKKTNIRKEYLSILQNINLEDTKHSAYIITKYGHKIAIHEREKQLLEDLIVQLEIYKYKKDVPKFSDEVKTSFGIFMDSLDV